MVYYWGKSGHKLKAETWRQKLMQTEAFGGVLLTGLLLMVCSVGFLIQHRITRSWVTLSIVNWAHNSTSTSNQETPPQTCLRQSYRGIFSVEVSFPR